MTHRIPTVFSYYIKLCFQVRTLEIFFKALKCRKQLRDRGLCYLQFLNHSQNQWWEVVLQLVFSGTRLGLSNQFLPFHPLNFLKKYCQSSSLSTEQISKKKLYSCKFHHFCYNRALCTIGKVCRTSSHLFRLLCTRQSTTCPKFTSDFYEQEGNEISFQGS